jgi:nitric oxide dioxygenase
MEDKLFFSKKIKNAEKLIEYPKSGIISKGLGRTPKYDLTLFCMARGEKISEHTSTNEGFVFIIEGDGVFNLEGRPIRMSPGIFINMRKNAVHSLLAKKNTSFILLLIK